MACLEPSERLCNNADPEPNELTYYNAHVKALNTEPGEGTTMQTYKPAFTDTSLD